MLRLWLILALGCGGPEEEEPALDRPGDKFVPENLDVNEYLVQNAVPLDSLTASHDDDSDLESFDVLQSGEVVMLGEPDHGVAEAKEARLRLLGWLYHHHGVTDYYIEAGRGQANLIQAYVSSGDENYLDDLDINDYASMARVVETFDFYRGLRDLVVTRPAGVPELRVRGYDLDHGMRNASEYAAGYVETWGTAEQQDTALPLVTCTDWTFDCEDAAFEAVDLLETDEAIWVSASGQDAFDEALGVVRSLAQTLHFYTRDYYTVTQYRENTMMERFDEYYAQKSGRVVVYGHNFHISTDASNAPGWRYALGEHIRDELGDDEVYALGMFYDHGSHLASYGTEVSTVSAPPTGHLEAYLRDAGMPMFLLDFGTAVAGDPGSGWVFDEISCMANGYPDVALNPGASFDGVLFFEEATATTPL